MPRIAPPPLGRATDGASTWNDCRLPCRLTGSPDVPLAGSDRTRSALLPVTRPRTHSREDQRCCRASRCRGAPRCIARRLPTHGVRPLHRLGASPGPRPHVIANQRACYGARPPGTRVSPRPDGGALGGGGVPLQDVVDLPACDATRGSPSPTTVSWSVRNRLPRVFTSACGQHEASPPAVFPRWLRRRLPCAPIAERATSHRTTSHAGDVREGAARIRIATQCHRERWDAREPTSEWEDAA